MVDGVLNLRISVQNPNEFYNTPHRGLAVMSYGPEPLLRKFGLDTDLIIVTFSSKGVNQIVNLVNVAAVL